MFLKKSQLKSYWGGEHQVSDEAAFWASLITTITVKAGHSLGYYSLFGIHDHMAHPVPEMLFGQGVAAVVLATSHYAAKYREPIKDLALRVGKKVVEGAKSFDKKMNDLGNPPDVVPNVAVMNPEDQNKE